VAIAAAYAILGKENPLRAVRTWSPVITVHFHLTEAELGILYVLIARGWR